MGKGSNIWERGILSVGMNTVITACFSILTDHVTKKGSTVEQS